MRRYWAAGLVLATLLALLPAGVQAKVTFGPTREVVFIRDLEHLEGNWPIYLDMENHQFVAAAAQADVFLAHDAADGVLTLKAVESGGGPGVRGVAPSSGNFAAAVDPPATWQAAVRLAQGQTYWVRTRSGRAAKLEVLAFLDPGFASGAWVRYAVEGDLAPAGAGDTGMSTATFTAPARVTLPSFNNLTYLDADTGTLTAGPETGDLVYMPPNLLHLDNAGRGLQRLAPEPGFAQKATYYNSGWEHAVPISPGSAVLFKGKGGQLFKLHVLAADSQAVTLDIAPAGMADTPYKNLNPGLLAAYTVVLWHTNSTTVPLDLLGEQLAAVPANHVTVTPAGFSPGARTTGMVRIPDPTDLGIRTAPDRAAIAAEPGVLAAVYSPEGVLERVRWVVSHTAPYRLGVHVLPVAAYPEGEAKTLLRTPLNRTDIGITDVGGHSLGSVHVPVPGNAEIQPSGGVVIPGGLGSVGPIGYVGGTLFLAGQGNEKGFFRPPAFGAFIDPEVALRQPGEYPADLFFDGRNIVRGDGARVMYKLGDVPVEQVLPGSTGEAAGAVSPTPQTLLVERQDGKAALVRIDSSGQHGGTAWVKLRIFFQPDGSKTFWRVVRPSQRVVKLKIGDTRAYVNDQPSTLEAPPQLISNTTMVPLRFVAEALGARVGFDNLTKVIRITLDTTEVTMQVNNPTAQVNGRAVALQVPPTVVNGRTLVPIRFVSEGLGAHVAWDNATKTVTITK